MRVEWLAARGFRNLQNIDLELPSGGAVLLGANGQGKTNLLEALYYPALFRSLRSVADQDLVGFGGPGFQIRATFQDDSIARGVTANYVLDGRQKRVTLDGLDVPRLAQAVGAFLAVVFLPSDVDLAGGGAAERRAYLDRMLSLADSGYLAALTRYRAALAQRNAALRQHQPALAAAFDGELANAGAHLVRVRLAWVGGAAEQFSSELKAMGESASARLTYRGAVQLAQAEAWSDALAGSVHQERARGITVIGPHRDDIQLYLGERPVRTFGSAGQQRSAAVALKLIEIRTLREARRTEPLLLLDDVFAELDSERQERLASRLRDGAARQMFVTSPRRDELPGGLELPVWRIEGGKVLSAEC